MKIVIDMNLPTLWTEVLTVNGLVAIHWRNIGPKTASDSEIMQWARDHGYVVFTHDLDFGTLLALTQAESPSVLQVRTQNVTPKHLQKLVLEVLEKFAMPLEQGALIVVHEDKVKVRLLPLNR